MCAADGVRIPDEPGRRRPGQAVAVHARTRALVQSSRSAPLDYACLVGMIMAGITTGCPHQNLSSLVATTSSRDEKVRRGSAGYAHSILNCVRALPLCTNAVRFLNGDGCSSNMYACGRFTAGRWHRPRGKCAHTSGLFFSVGGLESSGRS